MLFICSFVFMTQIGTEGLIASHFCRCFFFILIGTTNAKATLTYSRSFENLNDNHDN